MASRLRLAGLASITLATIAVSPSCTSNPKPDDDALIRGAHLRIARPTDDLAALVGFYRDGLDFDVIDSFDHDGYEGAMLGHAGARYHLEFIRHQGHTAGRAPTNDNLLVFYIPDKGHWSAAVGRMETHGYEPVPSDNPYWDDHGKTFEDPDGYRVVLQNAAWSNTE